MVRTPSLRASDSDREQAAERLRHATAEGRLSADELEQRLEVLYRTRTYGELDRLVADLPVRTSARAVRVRIPLWVGALGALTLFLAVLGILAGAVRHSTEVVAIPRRVGPLGPPAAPLESHRLVVAATSGFAVFALLAVCVILLWLLMRSRHGSGT